MARNITYLTTAQAASKLKLSWGRVRTYCREGRIGVMMGRNYMIPESDLAKVRGLKTGRPRKIPRSA